jgi:LPXTG-motif cell wall-anchored protein
MTLRTVARACATGLLAACALTFVATPALAADTDLGIDIKGSTLALGIKSKPVTITVANHGITKPSAVTIRVETDVHLGDKAVVDLGGQGDNGCTLDAQGRADCVVDRSVIPAPGGSIDLSAVIRKVEAGVTGKAGKLTMTLVVEGDSNQKNDSDTVDISLAGTKGVDLTVVAEDVTLLKPSGWYSGKPIPAGGKSIATASVFNYGDQIAAGFSFVGTLPKGATFTTLDAEECDFSADQRTVHCALKASLLSLPPQTGVLVEFEVVVARDVKGPVSLQGGSWTFVADKVVDTSEPIESRIATTQALPDYVSIIDPAELARMDLDPSDNVDGFTVFVAGPSGGTGGGTGDNGGDQGGLPVTGPIAGTVAGLGGAVLVGGAVVFMLARRRRVVLVTPRDGR